MGWNDKLHAGRKQPTKWGEITVAVKDSRVLIETSLEDIQKATRDTIKIWKHRKINLDKMLKQRNQLLEERATALRKKDAGKTPR